MQIIKDNTNEIKAFFDHLAPHWNEAEMKTQDEIFSFLSAFLPVQKGDRVLDVGCGTGIASNSLYKMSGRKVKAIDLSDEMIAIAKETHDDTIEYAVENFFETEGEYDFIVCFNAYPHFLNVEAFAGKAASLLKEGGRLAIIHNLSRAQLSTHHAPLKAGLSRELKPVNEEVVPFLAKFLVDKLIDNEKMFMMLLTRG